MNLTKEVKFSRNGTSNNRISPVKNKIEKPNSSKRIGLSKNSWQRPTLPCSYPHSTIGPTGLVCSVRNGKRNFTRGIIARKSSLVFEWSSVRNVPLRFYWSGIKSEKFHRSRRRRDSQKTFRRVVRSGERTPHNQKHVSSTYRYILRTQVQK